jgi:hypothetical protein
MTLSATGGRYSWRSGVDIHAEPADLGVEMRSGGGEIFVGSSDLRCELPNLGGDIRGRHADAA